MEEAVEGEGGVGVLEEGLNLEEIVKDSAFESSPQSSNKLASNYITGSEDAYVEGALAVIYHEDKKSGELEFYLETKSPTYSFTKFAGKNALVGGVIDPTDKSPHSALVREINEEIQGDGAKILERIARDNPTPYHIEEHDSNGVPVRDYVFKLEIKDDNEWETVKNSSMTNDAGFRTILTRNDIADSNEGDWAFNHYNLISKFINDNQNYRSLDDSSRSNFSNYLDSIRLPL